MGNGISCFNPTSASNGFVKLVFYGGATKLLAEKQAARELMVQFPDSAICDADSFYSGQPIPILSIDDQLILGKTYLIIPLDQLPGDHLLTAASLVSLLSTGSNKVSLASLGQSPFEYVKGVEGKTLIKVLPEFIVKGISSGDQSKVQNLNVRDDRQLCSTPELKKHYEQLVVSRWSPKLETISEQKRRPVMCPSPAGRLSPVRLFGLHKL